MALLSPTSKRGWVVRCEVFDPPFSFWCSDSPPEGGAFTNPSGLVDAPNLSSRISTWSNPRTGYVHAMHGDLWGSWVFAIDSTNPATSTIAFGIGGTQEGRGSAEGAQYFVANLLEELDAPGEYFIDSDARVLYLMPNETLPTTLVLSQLPCIISVEGSIDAPAVNITVHGLMLSHTAQQVHATARGALRR